MSMLMAYEFGRFRKKVRETVNPKKKKKKGKPSLLGWKLKDLIISRELITFAFCNNKDRRWG